MLILLLEQTIEHPMHAKNKNVEFSLAPHLVSVVVLGRRHCITWEIVLKADSQASVSDMLTRNLQFPKILR